MQRKQDANPLCSATRTTTIGAEDDTDELPAEVSAGWRSRRTRGSVAHRLFSASGQGIIYLRVASGVTCLDSSERLGPLGGIENAVDVVQLFRCCVPQRHVCVSASVAGLR
jgi:hypothetical protein